jgi:hypothetical protein
MKKQFIRQLIILSIGSIISITAAVLAYYWYGWHLVFVLFLALLGNNLERIKVKEKKEEVEYRPDEISYNDFRNYGYSEPSFNRLKKQLKKIK